MRPITITQTNAGSTRWVSTTPHLTPFNLTVGCEVVSGSPAFTVEYTLQDVNYNPDSTFAYVVDSPTLDVYPDPLVQGATVTTVATQTSPVWAARVTVTGTGVVRATFLQAGIAGP